jgi:hypothetical protein
LKTSRSGWEVVDWSKGIKALRGLWVFSRKANGRFKARLVVVKLINEIVFRNRGGGDEVRGEDEERRREDED